MPGLFDRLLRKKPAAAKPEPAAHQHPAWTAQQFRALLASGELADIDAAKQVGHPVESVRRIRQHVHLFHRDGAKGGLPDNTLQILRAEHEPWTCAVCKTTF